MLKGIVVGVGSFGLIITIVARHPEIIVAVRVLHLHTLVIPRALGHAAYAHTLEGGLQRKGSKSASARGSHSEKATEGTYFMQPSMVMPIVPL